MKYLRFTHLQLNDTFLEDPETVDNVASESENESSPTCFCSAPRQIVQEYTEHEEDDSSLDLRKALA
ncbi:hypothetical protein UY3_18268 [Chelonia mydas]|uniref:Uncharacterized protein n=1 Tax=Chelonia mydas TaxID=8469 RepID=M7APF7_CHEMY|nr:hypothetical protein UY3_18268 [Chelonia mydas]